jgi:manganese/iron transport system substrate-binding protein
MKIYSLTAHKVPLIAIRNVYRILWCLLIFTACSGDISTPVQPQLNGNRVLKVVATTSIVFDVVKQVGGDLIDLDLLLPIGTDPHTFEPTPQDIAKLSQADVIFINGSGLETFLDRLIESSEGEFRIEDLSRDIQLIKLGTYPEGDKDHSPGDFDPHIWMDPNNVILWVKQILALLSDLDPENSPIYEANAQDFIDELVALDRWIVDLVREIPPEQRNLITDHLVFGYFAKAYGFFQVSAILPSFSTLSQPSAQEIANLEDTIRDEEIKAIFVSVSVNQDLARRITEDTGTQLVFVHTGSLTEPGGTADSYIDLIRYDVNAIVEALR